MPARPPRAGERVLGATGAESEVGVPGGGPGVGRRTRACGRPRGEARATDRRPQAGRLDKAFPVFLEGERGVAAGIGRNISDSGMFVETREPFPLGSRVRVTFTSPSGGAEMVLEGEVRYQCFINFTRADAV